MLIFANFLHTYSIEKTQGMWYSKFNTFTQSVDYVVKAHKQGIISGKGMGWESPAVKLSVCASNVLYPLSKDSHWETEKAGYENADESVYMVRVTRPALMLFRKCAFA